MLIKKGICLYAYCYMLIKLIIFSKFLSDIANLVPKFTVLLIN